MLVAEHPRAVSPKNQLTRIHPSILLINCQAFFIHIVWMVEYLTLFNQTHSEEGPMKKILLFSLLLFTPLFATAQESEERIRFKNVQGVEAVICTSEVEAKRVADTYAREGLKAANEVYRASVKKGADNCNIEMSALIALDEKPYYRAEGNCGVMNVYKGVMVLQTLLVYLPVVQSAPKCNPRRTK